jgi:hypothetical protein
MQPTGTRLLVGVIVAVCFTLARQRAAFLQSQKIATRRAAAMTALGQKL